MRMDKLTSRFQQALADAQSLAVGRDHNMLEPVHVMTALLDQQGGSTTPLLAQAGVNVAALRPRLGQALDKLPSVKDIPELKTVLIKSTGGVGPLDSKPIGEFANNGPPAAIATAIADAVGVRLFELPVKAENIYRELIARNSPARSPK